MIKKEKLFQAQILDKLNTGMEDDISFESLDKIYSEDTYIAPEIIKKFHG